VEEAEAEQGSGVVLLHLGSTPVVENTASVAGLLLPRLLRIPDYQRGYAWEEEQVRDFLDDLSLLEQGHQHYTGTVVLLVTTEHLIDDDSQPLLLADVVDGQQRLTTICIVINEIRRALELHGQQEATAGLRRQYLMVRRRGIPLPKLQVAPEAQALWLALLQDQELPVAESLSTRRLRAAVEQIRTHVGLITAGPEPLEAIFTLRDKVISALNFTLYELKDAADVGVIFETLNDRGKPLTELEKVKNYLLFLAARVTDGRRQVLIDEINSAWTRIYRLLLEVARVSSAGEDQFLRAHWLANQDPVPRSWRGTKSVKERFSRQLYQGDGGQELLTNEVTAYVRSLSNAAEAFADSLRPSATSFQSFEEAHARRARVLHEKLRRADSVAVFQPMMIALRDRAPADGKAYTEVLDLALRFAVRVYLLAGYRTDTAQGRLYRLAHDVMTQERELEDVERALRSLVAEYADDHHLKNVFEDVEENWYRWSGLKFFLYEYELHLLRDAEPSTDYSYFEKRKRQKTVEHVLPQTATSPYWRDRFDDEAQRHYRHSLGNLMLTLDNSAYSNKDFPDKRGAAGPGQQPRACYAQSTLRQEQELAVLDDWTPAQIEDRQRRLGAWALQHWAVDLTDLDEAPEEEVEPEEDALPLPSVADQAAED
jgi:hypothetical protein